MPTGITILIIGIIALFFGLRMEPNNIPLIVVGVVLCFVAASFVSPWRKK